MFPTILLNAEEVSEVDQSISCRSSSRGRRNRSPVLAGEQRWGNGSGRKRGAILKLSIGPFNVQPFGGACRDFARGKFCLREFNMEAMSELRPHQARANTSKHICLYVTYDARRCPLCPAAREIPCHKTRSLFGSRGGTIGRGGGWITRKRRRMRTLATSRVQQHSQSSTPTSITEGAGVCARGRWTSTR